MYNNEVKSVFVLGLKWFDKVNSKIYHRAVVFLDNGERLSTEYQCGYGNDYYYNARKLCNEKGIIFDNPFYTDKYVLKAQAKDKNYY